jgi:hypothetical protein
VLCKKIYAHRGKRAHYAKYHPDPAKVNKHKNHEVAKAVL